MILPSGLNAGLSWPAPRGCVRADALVGDVAVAVDLDRHDLALEQALLGGAARALRCERTASSSSSERGISHWSAIISAPRPWPTMLCFSISFGVNAAPNSCWVFMPAANGMWPMCSTPEPITTSWMPDAISAAPKLTACWAEPHCRSTVVAAASIGSPSCSQALRATLKACSPNCCTQPAITSSTSAGSMPVRVDQLGVGLAEQVGGVGVLVVALLDVPAPDRRAHGFDDHDLATLLPGIARFSTCSVPAPAPTASYPDRLASQPKPAVGMVAGRVEERLAIAGSGAIACGLAAVAARHRRRRAARPLRGVGRPRDERRSQDAAASSARTSRRRRACA